MGRVLIMEREREKGFGIFWFVFCNRSGTRMMTDKNILVGSEILTAL